MKIYYKATQGDPTQGCYYTSNYHLKKAFQKKWYLTENVEEADIIYISENCGGLELFRKFPDKIKVLQLVCSHPKLYCKLMEEECNKFDMWDERPFIWAPIRQEEIDLADYIIVYSNFSKKACTDNGVDPDKVIVISKGVETNVFSPKDKEDKEFTVLIPGQQLIMKGIQYAMKAYKELKEGGFGFKIILCGDKTTHMAKDRVTRTYEIGRLIPKEIENHGRVSRNRLIELYNQSDVVLCPSIEDSFNMTVLEALSCNKPVICTENTGAGELLEHHKTGSIIPIRDVKAIKEEIKYWKNNKPQGSRKLVKLNKKPVSKRQAKSLMAFFVDRSLSARGRISKAKGKIKKSRLGIPSNYFDLNRRKFREFKIRKGKPIFTPNRFIERRGKRLDTQSERKNIKLAALLSRKRKQVSKRIPPPKFKSTLGKKKKK